MGGSMIYIEALFYKKVIMDAIEELNSNVVSYKKSIRELEQVVNTMYDEDYNTSGSKVSKSKTDGIFNRLNSCNFGDRLPSFSIEISTVKVEEEK